MDEFKVLKIEKSQFYQAIERGHALNSRTLFTLGADIQEAKKLAQQLERKDIYQKIESFIPEREIFCDLLFAAILYKNTARILFLLEKFKQLFPGPLSQGWITDLQALIELAAFVNDENTTNTLLKIHPHPRRHELIRSAAYWSALNNNDLLFKNLCPTEEDYVIALWQLKQDKFIDAFTKYFAKASSSIQNKYDQRFILNIIPHNPETIEHSIKDIYVAALKNNIDDLNFLNDEHRLSVTTQALRHVNFVALQAIFKTIAFNKKRFIAYSLIQGRPEIATLTFITYDINPDEICQNWLSHPELTQLILSYHGKEAFWYEILRRNTTGFSSPDIEKKFITIPKKDKDIFKAIILCMQDSYKDPGLEAILTYSDETSLAKRLTDIKLHPKTQVELNRLFALFGIPVRHGYRKETAIHLEQLPTPILENIITLFSGNQGYRGTDDPKYLNSFFYLLSSNRFFMGDENKKEDIFIQNLHRGSRTFETKIIEISKQIDLTTKNLNLLTQFKIDLATKDSKLARISSKELLLMLSLSGSIAGNSYALNYSLNKQKNCGNPCSSYDFFQGEIFALAISLISLVGGYLFLLGKTCLYLSEDKEHLSLSRCPKVIRDKVSVVSKLVPQGLSLKHKRYTATDKTMEAILQTRALLGKQRSIKKYREGIYHLYQNQTFFQTTKQQESKFLLEAPKDEDITLDLKPRIANLETSSADSALLMPEEKTRPTPCSRFRCNIL